MRPWRTVWRENGLSIVLAGMFLCFLAGQILTGHQVYDEQQGRLGQQHSTLLAYLASGHFVSATFENWESEFLQMAIYVLATVVLRQRGSAESRPLRASQEEPRIDKGKTPWPARAGGVLRVLYGHSLALAFGVLFVVSFVLHALGSWRQSLMERVEQGEAPLSFWEHLLTADFWFESLQNWQSEFLAVLAIVVLSIWLRQKDSPQSKPVDAPHDQTGT